VAAGVVILEEAGGRVSTADGLAYSVFDRSLLATNDALCVRFGCDGWPPGFWGGSLYAGGDFAGMGLRD